MIANHARSEYCVGVRCNNIRIYWKYLIDIKTTTRIRRGLHACPYISLFHYMLLSRRRAVHIIIVIMTIIITTYPIVAVIC